MPSTALKSLYGGKTAMRRRAEGYGPETSGDIDAAIAREQELRDVNDRSETSLSDAPRNALAGCVGGQAREQTVLTPPWFIEELVTSVGEPLALDPCTTPKNPLGARVFATEDDNGLEHPWHLVTRQAPGCTDELVHSWQDGTCEYCRVSRSWGFFYCNPPFNALEVWLRKARAEYELGARGFLLGPARAHRDWFPALVRGLPVLNLRPLRFVGNKSGFPEGLCVVSYGLGVPTIRDMQSKSKGTRSMITSVTSYGLQLAA
jgi:hypothetical protein